MEKIVQTLFYIHDFVYTYNVQRIYLWSMYVLKGRFWMIFISLFLKFAK